MAGDKSATFTIKIDGDAKPAASAADELERLKKSIDTSKGVIESYSKSLRSLRGNSDEVKSAKAQLKARIDAERDSISRNSLSILKLGTSYEQLSKKTKKAEKDTKSFKDVVGTVGGPVAEVTSKFGSWKDALAACANPLVGLGLLAAATVAGVVALSAAVVGATIALAKFVLESANVLRAQELMREGALGNEANAKAFGQQIDDLATKLSTPKAKLNDLAVELSKTFNHSRVSGQAIVDTFEAVSRASDAMGDSAGAALKSIVERGKLSGRIGVNPLELRAIGLEFNDLAADIAKNTGRSMAQVRQQLLAGVAPADDVARALKDISLVRFGDTNAKKLLDLDTISVKFWENLQGLSKDASKALQPFYEGLKTLADQFSDTTSTGHSLKEFVTGFATALGAIGKAALPFVVQGLKQAINYGLRFGNALLDLTIAIVKWAKSSSGQAEIKATLAIVTYLAETALGTFEAFVHSIGRVGPAIDGLNGKFASFVAFLGQILPSIASGWGKIGEAIVDGITNGIPAAWGRLKAAIVSLATDAKNEFKHLLGISSPSKVFAEFGRQTVAGYAQGVSTTSDDAQDAVATMVTQPPPAAPSGGGGAPAGPARPAINITFQISGTDAQKTATIIKSDSVLEALTHAIEVANRGIGVPTQQPAGA